MVKYLTVNEIIDSQDSLAAKEYLKKLWYAVVEGHVYSSLNFEHDRNQFLHLRACAPENWQLSWNASNFSLTRKIEHHGTLTININPNGKYTYTFY